MDSSVVAALLHRAIGQQLVCVFVDHGLLRLGEADQVMSTFARHLGAQVLRVDAEARQLRQRYENEGAEVEAQAYAKISRARFEIFGSSVPPDATFTLRLAFGVVAPHPEDGPHLAAFTIACQTVGKLAALPRIGKRYVLAPEKNFGTAIGFVETPKR